ncbi:MAG: ParM/StbA family protein [Anaerolineae bacterium]|nr:ParM/StbA family protein [Anaerolineae bacterium]
MNERRVSDLVIVGVDIGYGFTKATDGKKTVIFPSVGGDVVQADFDNELIKAGRGQVLTVDQTRWFYGWHAQKHSRNPLALFARERTEQVDLMLVLFRAAMAELGVANSRSLTNSAGSTNSASSPNSNRIALCTGLPVDWYDDKPELERLLMGEHVFTVGAGAAARQQCVHVCRVFVVPQPFGSFFEQVLDAEGALINAEFARSKVGVLDVGTYTTDYALSDGLEYVAKSSGSKTVAMSTVWRAVRDGIKAQWGIEYDLHQIDHLMRNGRTVTVHGVPRSVDALIEPAVENLAGHVLAGARERWGTARDFARILLTGGGAEYVKTQVQAVYPHAQVLNAPHLGNLRGFFKYARRKVAHV